MVYFMENPIGNLQIFSVLVLFAFLGAKTCIIHIIFVHVAILRGNSIYIRGATDLPRFSSSLGATEPWNDWNRLRSIIPTKSRTFQVIY